MIFNYGGKFGNVKLWTAWDAVTVVVAFTIRRGWALAIGEQTYYVTRDEARALLASTRCFILSNKPGMIIFGTDETYNREEKEGYAPWDIKPIQGDEEIWIDTGAKYSRFTSVNWPEQVVVVPKAIEEEEMDSWLNERGEIIPKEE
jgi:hypothetical protein